MADRGEEAGLALLRGLGLAGAQFDPLLQGLVDLAQRLFDALVVADVAVAGDVTAAGQRLSVHFDDLAVGAHALEHVRRARAQVLQPAFDVRLGVARPHLAAGGVPAQQVGDRPADVEHAVGVVEQLLVAAVPGDKPHLRIDHAHPLRDVLEGGGQHLAVVAQGVAGFVQQADHFAQLHARTAQHRGQGAACGGGAQRGRQQALGVLHQRAVGRLFGIPRPRQAAGVFLEGPPRMRLAEDAFGQGQQFAAAHLAGPAAGRQRRLVRVGIQVCGGGQLVLQQRPVAHRHEHERGHVAQQRPEHAVGQRIPAAQPEQRLRAQPGQAQRAFAQPVGAGSIALQQRRQQQAPGPQRGPAEQACIGAGTAGAAPVQPADQGRRELRHRGERKQAVLGEELLAQRVPVVGECDQCQQQDRHPAHPQHLAFDRHPLRKHPAPQQQRQHQVVADHGRQRHAGHDHHAGGRGQAADVGRQRQPRVAVRQRQRQHEAVRGQPVRAGQRLPGQRDRQHHRADQHQVADEQPARRLQVGRVLALDHRHVELARQAHDRGEREQGLGEEARWQGGAGECAGAGRDPGADAAPARQVQDCQRPDRHERQQLDQRFQRDRQHHPAVVLGGIDPAGAEQDREGRQQQRHVQGRVGIPLRRQRLPAEHAHAHPHRLELQREVGDRGDHRQHRHRRRQPARASVA